jgi:hypothetical protein
MRDVTSGIQSARQPDKPLALEHDCSTRANRRGAVAAVRAPADIRNHRRRRQGASGFVATPGNKPI